MGCANAFELQFAYRERGAYMFELDVACLARRRSARGHDPHAELSRDPRPQRPGCEPKECRSATATLP